MLANGMRDDEHALVVGIGCVRDLVASGVRALSLDELQKLVDSLDLYQSEPATLAAIQAIDRDQHPEDASFSVDWVDLFEGDHPSERIAPTDPDVWETRMRPDLEEMVRCARSASVQRVLVRGSMRLPIWFAVGTAFSSVAGFDIMCRQRGQVWSSEAEASGHIEVLMNKTELNQGVDLAVVVDIAAEATEEVVQYARTKGLPVKAVVSLGLAGGAHDQTVRNARHAASIARAARDAVRRLVGEHSAERLHLFLAVPGGLALLLGHRWNRIATTVPYEHLGPGAGYIPTFTIPG